LQTTTGRWSRQTVWTCLASKLNSRVRHSVKRFDPTYFSSVPAYNRLCFSSAFYRAFSEYEYMLVCQLDAWIFADRLSEWVARGYDYIGAPWCIFCRNRQACDANNRNECVGAVGNGGLSLRRVSKFAEVTSLGISTLANEDIYFSSVLSNKPPCKEAFLFSVETGFEKFLGEQFHFGCHAPMRQGIDVISGVSPQKG